MTGIEAGQQRKRKGITDRPNETPNLSRKKPNQIKILILIKNGSGRKLRSSTHNSKKVTYETH